MCCYRIWLHKKELNSNFNPSCLRFDSGGASKNDISGEQIVKPIEINDGDHSAYHT